MATSTPSPTRADELYGRLRADILSARLKPGERLKFPNLCRDYNTSVGVAREVLTRLAAERLVVPVARQGFSVVELSREELVDLTTARSALEGLVLEQAMLQQDPAWEASVLAAHHVLSRAPYPQPSDDAFAEWSQIHEAFHAALLAGCPSRRLREAALALRDEAELYRRWSGSLVRNPHRDLAAEHQAMVDAVVAGDTALAVSLLKSHIGHTAQLLLALQDSETQ